MPYITSEKKTIIKQKQKKRDTKTMIYEAYIYSIIHSSTTYKLMYLLTSRKEKVFHIEIQSIKGYRRSGSTCVQRRTCEILIHIRIEGFGEGVHYVEIFFFFIGGGLVYRDEIGAMIDCCRPLSGGFNKLYNRWKSSYRNLLNGTPTVSIILL